MHFCFFVVVILYLISQQPIICITRNIIQKDPLKENNIHNLKDPFLILRRCPNLPCQYKNDPEFRHLCPQLSTFDLLPNQHIGEENDEARDYHQKDGVLHVYNTAGVKINIFQIDHHGRELQDKTLEKNEHFEYYTFEGAAFRIKDANDNGNVLMEFIFSGYNGKAYVSACELPSKSKKYSNDNNDETLNIFVSENLIDSFFWWKNAMDNDLISNDIPPELIRLTNLDAYPNFDEPLEPWNCFNNEESNHNGIINGEKFDEKQLRKLLNKNNVLTIASALKIIGKVNWKRPYWADLHLGIFEQATHNAPGEGLSVDLVYVSDDDNDPNGNTECYLTVNANDVKREDLKSLYPNNRLISNKKTSIGNTINLNTEHGFSIMVPGIEANDDDYALKSEKEAQANIWSIDFNIFSLENDAARTLRARLSKLSLTAMNEFHDCLCYNLCNRDNNAESMMSADDQKRFRDELNQGRYPLTDKHKLFHGTLVKHIQLMPYNYTSGYPFDMKRNKLNGEHEVTWDNFWLYWKTFEDFDNEQLSNAFKSFQGSFQSQFCSTSLHYSHPIELKNDIFQAIEGLKLSVFPLHENEGQRSSVKRRNPNLVTISLSNFEHAPLHDLVFIERHILDLLMEENMDKDHTTLEIQGKRIRLIYTTKFEFNHRAHGKKETHWPKHINTLWNDILTGSNQDEYNAFDYDGKKPIYISEEL